MGVNKFKETGCIKIFRISNKSELEKIGRKRDVVSRNYNLKCVSENLMPSEKTEI